MELLLRKILLKQVRLARAARAAKLVSNVKAVKLVRHFLPTPWLEKIDGNRPINEKVPQGLWLPQSVLHATKSMCWL
jgi:hypothetical protein